MRLYLHSLSLKAGSYNPFVRIAILLGFCLAIHSPYSFSKSIDGNDECLWEISSRNFLVCDADAGTITANQGFLCVPGTFAIIEATPDGNMIIPSGYTVAYVLTTGSNSLIVDVNGSPFFVITTEGAYTIHTLVYDPLTFDLNSIIADITTLQDLNVQFEQGGGSICASLDMTGATTLTAKTIGFVVFSIPETCDDFDGQVELAPPSNAFLWFDGFMGSSRNDLADGIYTVTVSDASMCTSEIEIVIGEVCSCPTPPMIDNVIVFEATCGNSDGSATINMIGNNNDYSYTWSSNVSSTNIANNLAAGSYDVTISEIADPSCSTVTTVVVENVDGPVTNIFSVTPATCNASDGTAFITPANFLYNWCDGGTGANRNNLFAGSCLVTVTDPSTNCTNVIEVVIPQANSLVNTINIVAQPDCGISNGQVDIVTTGGSGNYSYSWSVGGTGASRSDLAAGTYEVTVLDNTNGCSSIETFSLSNAVSGATVLISSDVELDCSGDMNGTVNFIVQLSAGFVQPPTEVIRDGAGNTYANGTLEVGNYCVLIFDGNGCLSGEECFEVTQPQPLTIGVAVVNQTCASLGSITTTVGGGNGSETYDWADLLSMNDPANRTDLVANTYQLTVTDINGCSASTTVNVTDECIPLNCLAVAGDLTIDASPVCLVGGTATISATPNGNSTVPNGYATAYVLTLGGVIQGTNTSPTFSVNTINDYVIHTLIYDPNTLNLSFIVPMVTTAQQVNDILIQGGGAICAALDLTGATASVINCNAPCTLPEISNIVQTSSNCNDSTGNATVNVVGNNNDYTFAFSSGNATANSVTGLPSGTYTVTITDNNNASCFITESFSIANADGPQATIISTSQTSCGFNNGNVQLSPNTFDYLWCDGGTGADRNDLFSGLCPVTVTDPNTGCTNVIVVEIEAADLLQLDPIINGNPDCGMSNGMVFLSVSGGSNNYTFTWSDPNSVDNALRNDLPGGTYGVTVVDNGPNGCVGETTFTLTENIPAVATVVIQNTTNETCAGNDDGAIQFVVNTDPGFVQPFNAQILDAAGNIYPSNSLPPGAYCVQVTDGNNCVAGSECFTIEAATPILVDADVLATTCAQGGSISLTVTGGNGNYTFDWDDIAGSNDPKDRLDLAIGTYAVTVTDSTNCIAILENINIEDGCTNCTSTAGTLQADSTNICFDGLTPITISATPTTIPNVPTGFNVLFVLTSGAGLEILQASPSPEFSVNALGNYTIHTLVFDPATLDPTTYTNGIDLNADLLQGGGLICASLDVAGAAITVINCMGCDNIQVQNTVTIEATCGNSDGGATITVAGNGTYNYEWSDGGSTTNSNFGLAVGTYTYTITDAMNPNCNLVDSLVIGNADGPELDIISQTPASCNFNNGTIVLDPPSFLYEWSDGGVGTNRNDLAPGINIVTITDPATNCTNVFEILIESLPSLDIQVDIVQQPDCQASNGEVAITVNGGSLDYTYIWSDNPNLDVAIRTNLAAGAYGLTVVDNGPNGCIDSTSFVLLDNNVIGASINITNPNGIVSVSCSGNADAEVLYTVAPSIGFVTPATEMIIDGNGNPQVNGQLGPGNYCIVVMDGNGCVAAEECFEVIDPDPIDVNIQVSNATCTDPGSITTLGFGGTGFLLFDWADLPNTSDPQNRFNLTPGFYSLTVTDQAGCSVVINDILVQDDCNNDCPSSSEEVLILPINTMDTLCVTLDSCFVDSLTTYTLLGGGTVGSSIYGSWSVDTLGCVVYEANDTAGVFVDTICVLANYNVLVDTTCIIVTVLPECSGTDIIMADSITLVTADCVAGADYCLEIELAQILNFTLTDNGQPSNIGNQGCNFDTTFFYSLSAFLAIAPNGPYTLTSWEIDTNTFTIDSFQTIMQLVDSMNVWDPNGNWILDGSIITGGMPGVNYGSLDIIELGTGASTNLDVDFNQIPNGTLLTLDTGFHELIITDLVTGCLDTFYADVICDDCFDFYIGPDTIVGPNCDAPTDLCLDIPFQEFLFNFEVFDNGLPYSGVRKGCGFDTLSTCYLVSALPDQGAAGPYSINFWEVGGITFASSFNDLQELLNLMNGWDPTGNWILDAAAGTICGGTSGQTYGMMEITQTNTGAIAVLDPDYVILTFASAIELDTGFHQIILVDTIGGCTDTIDIMVDCDVVTGGVDTLLIVEVSTTDTVCFNLTDTIVSAINLCPDLSDGNVSGFGFIPNTNCIEFTGTVIGLDTFCMVFELSDGSFDTTGIVIQVVPQTVSGDTIPVDIIINSTQVFCIDTSIFLAPLDTIYNDCPNASGLYSDVEILDPNCIEITGVNLGGLDTACIVICDTMGFCDTTVFLINVIPPMTQEIYDTVDIDQTYTYCVDSSELFGTLVSIENICDSLSGTSVDFTIDTTTFCIEYDAIEIGTDTACLVICDDLGICDTTIYIVTVINPIDTIIAVDDDTITTTINPVNIDIFANDIFNPDSLIFGIVDGVSNGTLVSNPDGSFTYLAAAGFCGDIDSFTYFISNGTLSDTATVTIEVLCDDIFVFNGFSPNNDGRNETLFIRGIENFPNNEVRIYNRWGNLVYKAEGYTNDEGWTGTFEGKDLPDGTYFYIIDDGNGNKMDGWLQINR